jgi:hypothetical protein
MNMKFSLSIRLDNAAFSSPGGCELARILRHLADHFDHKDLSETADKVFDGNGNSVGTCRILKE